MVAEANAGRSPGLHTRQQTRNRCCAATSAPTSHRHLMSILRRGAEMKYAVVIERTKTGYSAYVPDLPGCISVGATREELDNNIREAIDLYLDELREQGIPIPVPSTDTEYIAV